MNSEFITSEVIDNNKTLRFNIIFLFILILVLLLVLFYNDRSKITNIKYIYNVYNKQINLKNKFKNFINSNYKVNKINNEMWLLEDLLVEKYFNYLKLQFDDKKFDTKNFYYRKATGINFNQLHESNEYNGFLELYYSEDILRVLSNILKKPINRPPLSDNSSCSLLIYTNPGDFIDWHLDYSNYYGNRYVVLISLINSNSNSKSNDDCCSSNEFMYKDDFDNTEKKLKLKPNNMLIFKGSEVLHKSTEILKGEKRILLSMTFCDICQEKQNISYSIHETIKNFVLYK